MAGIKRKEPPRSRGHAKENFKKSKPDIKKLRGPVTPPSDLEAQTDSDPIIESDTTEQSGDDDGVSWPSDDEEPPIYSEKTNAVGVDGGVKLPTTPVKPLTRNETRIDSTNGTSNPTSSKESHAKQKAVAQERKAAKPNADSIARAKKLWERLRIQSKVPFEERKALVAELFEIITGRVKDFVLKHDSGRVIQTALKYGNLEQRKMMARELKGDYRALAESRYAKFMIGKLLVHGDEEIRDMVIPEFYGHVRRMIKHPEAAWILDDVYRGAATPKQKSILLREWYGAEFAIFRSEDEENPTSDLQTILSETPGKKAPIMRSLFELINQLVQKKTIAFTILHDAMLQYYLNVPPGSSEDLEFIELLKGDEEGDLLKNLAFTKSGARLVCLTLAHSSAKDRKLILRTYKSTIQALAFDPHGHQVLLTAYDVIDDTVLIAKSIFSEFPTANNPPSDNATNTSTTNLTDYITHLTARIPLLYLFTANPRSLLSPSSLALLAEIHTIRTTTSKKDPLVRRAELVKVLSPPLLAHIAISASTLVCAPFGCAFVTEVLLSAPGPDKTDALAAVADLPLSQDEDVQRALEIPAAGRMLKTLVMGGRFNQKSKSLELVDPPLGFSDLLYERIKGELVKWMTGPSAFVVVGLMESDGFGGKEEVLGVAKREGVVLREFVDGAGGGKEVEAGRKGARLLLRILGQQGGGGRTGIL